MENKVLFSVIVPTCNRPESLVLCLERLAPGYQTYTGNYEVIVTNDGNDTIRDLIQTNFPSVQLVQGLGKGPAANRNNGAKHASGEWLVFTDDDCLPEANWLEEYHKAINQNSSAKAFEGAIHPIGNLQKDFAECPVNLHGNCFWSANICVEKKLFERIKGFDESYLIAAQEDQDIYIQIKKYTQVPFVKEARVSHPVRYGSLFGSILKIRSRVLNWLYYARKNRRELGYSSDWAIIIEGYTSQIRALGYALKKVHLKRMFYVSAVIFYGLPVMIIHLKVTEKVRHRKFYWVSSKTGEIENLIKIDNQLSGYYDEDNWRDSYQVMLGKEPLPEKNEFSYLILEYIINKKPNTVLDIGCSNGRIYRHLTALGFAGKYSGVEVSSYLIENNKIKHPEASWETGSAYNLPFADAQFDLCFAFFVLEHLVFPERALIEMMRVISQGGTLVLIFPDFVASERLSSQQLGFSPNDTAIQKFKKGKFTDAFISIYDSRIRLPLALKNVHKNIGAFPVNANPICFTHPDLMSPDFDAVYIASKKEVADWAVSHGYNVDFPYGQEGELNEKVFLTISKV